MQVRMDQFRKKCNFLRDQIQALRKLLFRRKTFNDREKYEEVYKHLIHCSHCPFPSVCKVLPDKICQWLQTLDEEEAATWFAEAWGGDNGTWMNGFLMPGCALYNNALEATWKWLKEYSCSKGGSKATLGNDAPFGGAVENH